MPKDFPVPMHLQHVPASASSPKSALRRIAKRTKQLLPCREQPPVPAKCLPIVPQMSDRRTAVYRQKQNRPVTEKIMLVVVLAAAACSPLHIPAVLLLLPENCVLSAATASVSAKTAALPLPDRRGRCHTR